MATWHNAAEKGRIAERIVLVGDPNRAKMIAENYLEDAVLVNDIRCAYCYTGNYEGVRVSVMAVGMGASSMLIYATELCRDYGCKILVRAGTSGGFKEDMCNYDVVLSQAVSSTSGINDYIFNGHFSPCADFGLLCTADRYAKEMGIKTYVGGTIANDRLYRDSTYKSAKWKEYGILASEQEGEAFYTAAAQYGARALMMVGITTGVRVDENGNEYFVDLPGRQPARTVKDLVQLALKTAAHAE